MNMAEHLSSDVGPSARVETLIGVDQLAGHLPNVDVSIRNVAVGNARADNEFLFVTDSSDSLGGLPSSDVAPLSRSRQAKRRMFFAAAVATAFYGSFPAYAGSHSLADVDSSDASSMGALNATVSQAISSDQSLSLESIEQNALQDIDTAFADDETRLLMAELSRLAMSQASSGRVAGAGLMWADVAFAQASSSNASLREIGFSPSQQSASSSPFVLANYEYSLQTQKPLRSVSKQPQMSRAALRLVAQETIAASPDTTTVHAATPKTTAKAAAPKSAVKAKAVTAKNVAPKKVASKRVVAQSSTVLPPAMPVVTRPISAATTTATTVVAPTVLRGTTPTPSRANVKAMQRLVSVSPLQSSTRLSLSKDVGAGMKKVITVSSLKQLPPATQALPTNYRGSRRASVIPIGADMPSSGARVGNSSTTNSNMSALPSAPSLSPARPTASRMANQLEVATGTFVVLQTATDLDTVAVADPTIADVAVVNSRAVLVNGKTPGITSLVIVDRDKIRQYQVRVVSAPGTLPRDIVAQIGLPGVTVRQVRDALVLEGEVENSDEARRSVEIAGIYGKKVINNLTVRGVPTSDSAIAARLQGLIGLPNVTVSLFGDSVLLQGTADNAAQRALAEQVAAVSGRKVLNLIQSPLLTLEEIQASFASAPNSAVTGADGRPSESFDPTSITVSRVGDQLVLTGTALDQARIDQAIAIATRSGLQVINRIRLIPPVTGDEQFSRRVESAIGIATVRVSGGPKRVVLTGTVADSNVSNYAVQVSRSFASEVDNMLMTPNPIQINIDVQIVEINSNDARNLGVQFGATTLGPITPGTPAVDPVPGSAGVPGIPGKPATPDTRTVGTDFRQGEALFGNYGFGGFQLLDGLRYRLQALYSTGNARLLSNPRSTVLSGRTATFQVGGQVPIPSGSTTGGGSTSTTIVFKDFGILLEANPVGLDNGVVTMRVRTEVSQPDPTLGIVPPGGGGLIPGFSRRQTVTEVVVGRGGTVSLGGLIQNNVTQSISRIPLLSQIPILGKLFQSKQFQRNQTELVIFVTPRVLPNMLPAGSMAPASISISDNTTNLGTQLGNPGITSFSSGSSIAPSGTGQ